MNDADRSYFSCKECCYGVSGEYNRILAKLDQHEQDNPGHYMQEEYDDD